VCVCVCVCVCILVNVILEVIFAWKYFVSHFVDYIYNKFKPATSPMILFSMQSENRYIENNKILTSA
jgi:hypothetical protein